jgi:(4-(4-[2-(gamma-L-glutamylamino)ethyl]phenoxymethyl)furan-2-yl)methanamine synthase
MNWLALDIGGANLKLADGLGFAASHRFALWKDRARLARELRAAIAASPASDHLAVTMTGELADCFTDKPEGIEFILQAVDEAADGRHTRVYLVDGRLVSPGVALHHPRLVASANWHALARFCGRFAPEGSALMVDIGSTTTDIIPLVDAAPVCQGQTDTDRLLHGELVYTGVERSPVCALVPQLPWRSESCPVAQEVFATTRDVYLLLGDLAESPDDHHTADQRPATRDAAYRRMRRMLSGFESDYPLQEAVRGAQSVAAAQLDMLTRAARRVARRLPAAPHTVILAGQGEFLARRLIAQLGWSVHSVSLREQLGDTVSCAAPAHALAVLARQTTQPYPT